MSKKPLAILGLGSRATLFYLSQLNTQYNTIHGGFSTCPFFLLNTDFDKINTFLPHPTTTLDRVVTDYFNQIEKVNCQQLLIPNITLHETTDRLKTALNIIHPVKLSALKINENNWKQIILFGSAHTMQSNYIQDYYSVHNIEIIRPTIQDMETIDIVRRHIYTSTETDELLDKYHSLLSKYSATNPIIIACTELSIIEMQSNSNILDMAQLQIAEAIRLLHD
jgi:aspartate racemase